MMITNLEKSNIVVLCLCDIKNNIQIQIFHKMAQEIAARYNYAFSATAGLKKYSLQDNDNVRNYVYCTIDKERKIIKIGLSYSAAGATKRYINCHSSLILTIENVVSENGIIQYSIGDEFGDNFKIGLGERLNNISNWHLGLYYHDNYALEYYNRIASGSVRLEQILEKNCSIEYVGVIWKEDYRQTRDVRYKHFAVFDNGMLVKRGYLEEILGCKTEDFTDESKECESEPLNKLVSIGGKIIKEKTLIQHSDIDIRSFMTVIDRIDYSIRLPMYSSFTSHEVILCNNSRYLFVKTTPSFEDLLQNSTLDNMLLYNLFVVCIDKPDVLTKYQVIKENSNIKIKKV